MYVSLEAEAEPLGVEAGLTALRCDSVSDSDKREMSRRDEKKVTKLELAGSGVGGEGWGGCGLTGSTSLITAGF